MGRPIGIPYDIHVKANAGWGDVVMEAPYVLRWGREYELRRWHPNTRELNFYRLVIV